MIAVHKCSNCSAKFDIYEDAVWETKLIEKVKCPTCNNEVLFGKIAMIDFGTLNTEVEPVLISEFVRLIADLENDLDNLMRDLKSQKVEIN